MEILVVVRFLTQSAQALCFTHTYEMAPLGAISYVWVRGIETYSFSTPIGYFNVLRF